ncbi:fasciclin domain protein [Hyphomonas neptunium ATCC 15444]|uniref:Fasciclin domain protein n=3 Tax=Hyphomonadaceae TaxID=69657 RepID=Q0C5A5_HYPNA|nr:fasciclin domain protein [Hyphomonas neptunium ATCC 15444]KCZ95521.1 fasciclin domain-containing protein [Hyphomonas hirschiana VP5]
MKTLIAAASAALMIALPALAESDAAGSMNASIGLGKARAVAAVSAQPSDTLLAKASEAGKFSTLLSAINAAGVEEALSGPGAYTIFAPTDAAFAKLPDGAMETLMKPENRDQLIALLQMHVVAGDVITAEKASGQQFTAETLNGPVAIDGTDPASGVWVNAVSVDGPDIRASNGVILAIDTLLLPAG